MGSSGMVKLGGVIGLLGAIVLLVEGALVVADRVLGTFGEIVLWVALALVATGAVTLFIGLLQGEPVTTEPEPSQG